MDRIAGLQDLKDYRISGFRDFGIYRIEGCGLAGR
jgi:hypothetical protein